MRNWIQPYFSPISIHRTLIQLYKLVLCFLVHLIRPFCYNCDMIFASSVVSDGSARQWRAVRMTRITKTVHTIPSYWGAIDLNDPLFEFVWDIMSIFWIYKIDNFGIAAKMISIYEYLPPSSKGLKSVKFYLHSPMRLHSMVLQHRDNFTLLIINKILPLIEQFIVPRALSLSSCNYNT